MVTEEAQYAYHIMRLDEMSLGIRVKFLFQGFAMAFELSKNDLRSFCRNRLWLSIASYRLSL